MSHAAQIAKGERTLGRVFAIRGVSEIAATSCALGAVAVLDKVAPNQMDSLYSSFAKTVVEPNIGFFEGALDKVLPGMKSTTHDEWRAETAPEERARSYAESMLNLGVIMFGTGLAAQALAQRGMEKVVEMPEVNPLKMKAWDYVAQSTTFGLMNMVFAKPTQNMQEATKNFLQNNMGMDEHDASERARYIVNMNIPNLAGFGFGVFQHNKELQNLVNKTPSAALA